jgi:hypothetical protein
MNSAEIVDRLRARFGDKIGDFDDKAGDPFVYVKADAIDEVCGYLENDEALGFDALSNLSGVDYPKTSAIQVVYHLYSYRHRHMIVLKVNANREDPVIRTVAGVWRAANWHGRSSTCSACASRGTRICAVSSCPRIGWGIPCARISWSPRSITGSRPAVRAPFMGSRPAMKAPPSSGWNRRAEIMSNKAATRELGS